MRGLAAYAGMMLRLQFRYRLAVFYSFLFPLIFLAAFRIFYRWDWIQSSGVGHLGELLVVAILGGTCFGLPVTMVSERERGVWRRYRLLPTPIWSLVGGAVGRADVRPTRPVQVSEGSVGVRAGPDRCPNRSGPADFIAVDVVESAGIAGHQGPFARDPDWIIDAVRRANLPSG